ncbi:hypothetical protein DL770_000646 [Monosporascus sp. CRB-9-2]|nr:hypothetical protein DL770_000646 [Monosporascus sp. CRB-9-2]
MAEPIVINLSDEDGSKRVVDELRTHFSTVRRWEFETLLQEGAYGVVVRIKKKPGLFVGVRRLAVKRALGEDEENQLRNEIKRLKKLRGAEHIVQIVAARDDTNGTGKNEGNGLERNDGGPETNIARRRKSRLKLRFPSLMRLFKRRAGHYLVGLKGPVIAMEYLENGTFRRLMARAKRHDIHLPNLMLWSLFLCPRGDVPVLRCNSTYEGIQTMATEILPTEDGHKYPMLDEELRDFLARCLAIQPDSRPRLQEMLQTIEAAVKTKTAGAFAPYHTLETDEAIKNTLQLLVYDANQVSCFSMPRYDEDCGDAAHYYQKMRPRGRHTSRRGQRESYSDDEVEYGKADVQVTRDSRPDKSYIKRPTIRLHNPSPSRSRSRNQDRPAVEHADSHKFGSSRVASIPAHRHYIGRDDNDATRGRLSPSTADYFYGGAKRSYDRADRRAHARASSADVTRSWYRPQRSDRQYTPKSPTHPPDQNGNRSQYFTHYHQPPVPERLRRSPTVRDRSYRREAEIEDLRRSPTPTRAEVREVSYRREAEIGDPRGPHMRVTELEHELQDRVSKPMTALPEDLRTHSGTPSTLSVAEQEEFRATQSNHSGPDKPETGISIGRTSSFRNSMTRTIPSRASTGSIPLYSSNRTFQYRSVEGLEFRLICLFPENMSMIKCEIMHASLESHPEYVALSYAWGDVDDTTKIQIDGCPFTITSSLHAALAALRKEHGSMILWADALCIDQNNKEEQSHQVQLMTRIYSQASSVAVWLGPEKDNSALAIDLLRRVSTMGYDSKAMKNLVEDESIRHQFAALVALFERDYFSRLWVVQEVLNAKSVTVYCGNNSLAWSMYVDASKAFQLHKKYLARTFGGGRNYGRDMSISQQRLPYTSVLSSLGPASLESLRPWRNKGPESLLEVLNICRRKLTGEPRDKVFGVLGILPEDVRYYFPPNYNESLREVYTNIVDFLLHTTRCFDVVCEAIYFPLYKSNANLPSWVPDWSHVPQTGPLALSYNFSAAGKTEAEFRFVDPPRRTKLEISALKLDSVACRGIAVGTLCGLDDSLMAFLHWRAKFLEWGRISDEAFCRTLCLGQSREWRVDQRPDEWTDSSSGTLT